MRNTETSWILLGPLFFLVTGLPAQHHTFDAAPQHFDGHVHGRGGGGGCGHGHSLLAGLPAERSTCCTWCSLHLLGVDHQHPVNQDNLDAHIVNGGSKLIGFLLLKMVCTMQDEQGESGVCVARTKQAASLKISL